MTQTEKHLFLNDYFSKVKDLLTYEKLNNDLIKAKEVILLANQNNKKIIFVGNGASAAIASHCALDFTKQAKIKSLCFSDSSLLTAFGNDYGYENWTKKALDFYAEKGDVIVLISSSGKSQNIVKAAEYSKANNYNLITLTGFEANNPLKQLGDINFWVNSKSYNIIECIHMTWLVTICDLIIGNSEYSVGD